MSISKDIPAIVYHYCSLETFFSIIKSSTIRMSNISKSNDSEEITYILPKMIKTLERIFSKYNNMLSLEYRFPDNVIEEVFNSVFNDYALNFYVSCFTENADLLSQWRGYANDANGVAIGFNTDMFYPLASEISSNYHFEQVRYSTKDMEEQIEKIIEDQINKNWIYGTYLDKDKYNANCLENIINRTISVIFYNSVLYKNSAFTEEAEWRLVYEPFGRIRRVTSVSNYFDRMNETFNTKECPGDFIQHPISFRIKNNSIQSYLDLDFSRIKKMIIREIVIGSKANIDDNDLRLFLLTNGYDIYCGNYKSSQIKIKKSTATYR